MGLRRRKEVVYLESRKETCEVLQPVEGPAVRGSALEVSIHFKEDLIILWSLTESAVLHLVITIRVIKSEASRGEKN